MSFREKNLQIEGLRGIAIMLVVIYHLIDRFQQIYLNYEIMIMNFWGSFGVTIFLIISGCFAVNIDSKAITLNEAWYALKKFFLRLWPAYAICICLTFILTHIAELPLRTYNLKELLLNLLVINHVINVPYIDGAHWYLTVLISMFLVVLVLKIFGIQSCPFVYCVWIAIASIIGCFYNNSFLFGGCFTACYCVGIAIRALLNVDKKSKFSWYLVLIEAFLATLMTRGMICTVEMIFGGFMVLLCLYDKLNFLNNVICIWIGKISYSLYLIHQNVGFWIEYQLMKKMNAYHLFFALIAIVVVVLLAVIIFYFIERPARSIIKK